MCVCVNGIDYVVIIDSIFYFFFGSVCSIVVFENVIDFLFLFNESFFFFVFMLWIVFLYFFLFVVICNFVFIKFFLLVMFCCCYLE